MFGYPLLRCFLFFPSALLYGIQKVSILGPWIIFNFGSQNRPDCAAFLLFMMLHISDTQIHWKHCYSDTGTSMQPQSFKSETQTCIAGCKTYHHRQHARSRQKSRRDDTRATLQNTSSCAYINGTRSNLLGAEKRHRDDKHVHSQAVQFFRTCLPNDGGPFACCMLDDLPDHSLLSTPRLVVVSLRFNASRVSECWFLA